MLSDARIAAVIPVADKQKAIEFYRDALGLQLLEDTPEGARFQGRGESALDLYESVGAGKSRHTLAAFIVDEIDRVVGGLRERGVVFEEYDLPEIKTESGIARVGDTRGAWFRDPDGNIIGIAEISQ